jgi:type IX secretion system PorP/SprF family membrane protein
MNKTFFNIGKLAFVLTMLFQGTVLAQQDPIYSQFMYNGLSINPAVAGSAETLSATAIYRKQWNNIEGAPETQTINLDAPVFYDRVGLGLSLINDKIGVTKNLTINTQYAYRILFAKNTLSMGLQGGVSNYKADYTSVVTNSQNAMDDAFSNNTNRMIFNFGAGLYFYNERFFSGFSVPHILKQSLDGLNATGVQSRQYRHYFFTTGYVFDIGLNFKVKPSTLVKVATGAPLQIDFNSNFWYKEMFCLGFSYRTKDSFSALVQLQIAKQFRIGYAYDYIISNLSRFTTGNNEILLRYELPKKNSKIITPRFF